MICVIKSTHPFCAFTHRLFPSLTVRRSQLKTQSTFLFASFRPFHHMDQVVGQKVLCKPKMPEKLQKSAEVIWLQRIFGFML